MADNRIDLGDKRVSFIGLGLIGGSLAKAFRQRLGIKEIFAVDCDRDAIDQAVAEGIICRGFAEVNEHICNSDIIFLCTPVKQAVKYLESLLPHVKKDCILTDVGSTKGEIVHFIEALPTPPLFIGGHPMAGSEKMGYRASSSHLFENAYYILTPCTGANEVSLSLMAGLVEGLGAIPVILFPEEHDRITGSISHLPHIAAFTLVNLVRELDSPDGKMQMLAAGGFKDITRIASSSPEMWENIVLSNKSQLIELLEEYTGRLGKIKNYIESEDSRSILEFFQNAKNYRDSFANSKRGLIVPLYDIIVDVVDKPGVIGEIATILGCHNINIKNINVSNSREFEQGCLRITLPDAESSVAAFDILTSKGYKAYKVN